MKAILMDDLVVGVADGHIHDGAPIPQELQALSTNRLRWNGSAVVDAAQVSTWWIDENGHKRIAQSDPAWQSLTCAWDAVLVNDGGTWRVQTDADRLAGAKAAGKSRLATIAEQARQQYITAGDGKAAIYALKRDEAKRWQAAVDAAQSPDAADYPWIDARATRLSVTAQDVADEWNAKAAAWEAAGRAIEDAYEAGAEAIDALSDAGTAAADVAGIIAGVSWP